MTEIVDAAVAVIIRVDGAVLLGLRPEGKAWAGWWEFPGGKIEAGETPAHALQRELHEELGIEATEYYPWLNRTFAYPERTVRLHFFTVRQWRNEPHGKENQQLSWQRPEKLTVSPLLPANEPILSSLQLPPVYGITNLAEMGEARFFAGLDAALEQGLKLIQVREKHLDRAALQAFATEVVNRARSYAARVLINGDEALARDIGADGVHLPAAALMSGTARPAGMLCGASCHDQVELAQAARLGLDYVLLAPVQATRSHPGAPFLGWESFADLARGLPMPVYALGGMTPPDLPQAWRHGAHGIAMLRGAWV